MNAAGTVDDAWQAYRQAIDTLRARMLASPLAADPADRVRAYHWIMQAEAAAYNLVIAPRPSHPRFLTHTVFEPNLYTWLLPNADFLYRYAFVDGTKTFRITGRPGTAHFLEAQVIGGFWGDPGLKLGRTYDFERFTRNADGSLEIIVGPEKPTRCPNWIETNPDFATNTIIIREAFWNWSVEHASTLSVGPVEVVPPPSPLDDTSLIA